MNDSPSVVPGEAPESDDEIQDDKPAILSHPSARTVVSGEAPESSSSASSECQSDIQKSERAADEYEAKTSFTPSTLTSPTMDIREKVLRSIRAQRKESQPSLLYTKLRENNMSLRTCLTDFVRQIGQQTNKEILAIDNDLLRSQVTLQEAITAYRQMNKNVKDISAALGLSPSLNGIPKIDIRTVL